MADKAYYAWNNFRTTEGVVKCGDKVTASKLGVSDEEFQEYVDNGAVRNEQYPDMGNFPGSPIELRKAQLAAMAAGGTFDTQYGRVAVEDVEDPEEVKKVEGKTKTP